MGMEATSSYNRYGYKTAETDYNLDSTLYSYDEFYRPEEIIYSDGNTVRYTYAENGRIEKVSLNGKETAFKYGKQGLMTKKTLSDGTSVEYTYNASGYPTRVVARMNGKIAARTDYTYDKLFRLSKVTDLDGNATTYKYDEVGNLIKMVNPIGAVTEYCDCC